MIEAFKEKQKIRKTLIILILLVIFIYIPLKIVPLLNFADIYSLHNSVNLTNPYDNPRFVYLYYFKYLMPQLYLERTLAVVITSLLNLLLIILSFQIEHNEKGFTKVWYLLISFSIVINVIHLNTDILIMFAMILYWKWRKKAFSPFILIYVIFKPITLPAVALIILIEIKENPSFFKNYRKIINFIIFGIFSVTSFYISFNLGYMANIIHGQGSNVSFFMRATHFCWLLYPIKILNDSGVCSKYLKEKQIIGLTIMFALIISIANIIEMMKMVDF